MTLITLNHILFILLLILFILFKNIKPKDSYKRLLNVIYYSVFSITLLWFIYSSIYISNFNDNFNIILGYRKFLMKNNKIV